MRNQPLTLDDLHYNLALAARFTLNHLPSVQLHRVEPISRELTALQLGKADTLELRRLIDELRPLMLTDEEKAAIDAFEKARIDLAVWKMA